MTGARVGGQGEGYFAGYFTFYLDIPYARDMGCVLPFPYWVSFLGQ